MSEFVPFSKKQLTALTFWSASSPYKAYDALICDGSIRSGKTLCMSVSFILWAFAYFDGRMFAICGKTVSSLRRNLLVDLLKKLKAMGFEAEEKLSKNYVDVRFKGKENRFYLFGGKDESSASLIQGITLAGVLLDEVALMPRSFVEQAIARCSVEGSKFFFNCNPENPNHWFYKEWIQKKDEKNALYLHFTMEDNPSLSSDIIKRYSSMYSGAFYDRFVKGLWVGAEGLVYPHFKLGENTFKDEDPPYSQFYISCDYGTVNPASFGLWGKKKDGVYHRIREFYFSSKKEGYMKTDREYYDDLLTLAGDRKISGVIVDPSAVSFMECIRREGKFKVIAAQNDVIGGIRRVSEALKLKKILISENCTDSIREFSLYRFNENRGDDSVRKENDHAMDDIRYFVSTILYKNCDDNFFVLSAER